MKMQAYLGYFLCYLCPLLLSAQERPYFQQAVDYQIDVRLDDQARELHGQLTLRYQNNSPDTLNELFLHLWPNAYANQRTAFAQQQLRAGKTAFHFADNEELGFIDSLTFAVDGRETNWEYYEGQADVARLSLSRPLAPGAGLLLTTPFRVRIPASFSRLGHVGESFQFTQWYPKPAVYDRSGWHPMPYLDNGEFYSEFGTFDVAISLPDNYIVAATGVLHDADELDKLRSLARQTEQERTYGFPPSSTTYKTLHYHAERVHDFAWFADKRFRVRTDTLQLASGRTVDAWVFFTATEAELWEEALTYVERATRFYSELVGEYPYPQVTAVQSALSAGAGMEYPMITVIGYAGSAAALDEVITHEVGHNWFYGILATDEREHAWIDEGVNSYYEQRYMRRYYPGYPALPRLITAGSPLEPYNMVPYYYLARQRADQAPATSSADFSYTNYWLGAYTKPALALGHLAAWLGEPAFDAAMQRFYQQWQFKHPRPQDLRTSLETATGQSLAWLFDDYIGTNDHLDYALTHAQGSGEEVQLRIANRGAIAAPFPVSGWRDGQMITQRWYPGVARDTIITFPPGSYDLFRLDADGHTLDVNRQNNDYRPRSLLPTVEPLQLHFGTSIDNPTRTQLFFLPLVGWNALDKTMLGLLLHNRAAAPRRWEWGLAPLYATGSKRLTGWAGTRLRWYPADGFLQEIRLQADVRRFVAAYRPTLDKYLGYTRLVPALQLHFRTDPAGPWRHQVQWRTIKLWEDETEFDIEGNLSGISTQHRWLHELSYQISNHWVLAPYRWRLALEQQTYTDPFEEKQPYWKLSLTGRGHWLYGAGRTIAWRIFGGYFLQNGLRESNFLPPHAFSLFDHSFTDYRYDDLYLGRNESDGLWAQQLEAREGGFKTPIGRGQPLGRSNSYLLSLNLSADLPFTPAWLPIQPYLDAGLYRPTPINKATGPQTLWNAGLALEWLDGRVGIYLPLAGSREIRNLLVERGNLWQRLSFRLSLTEWAPWRWLDELRL